MKLLDQMMTNTNTMTNFNLRMIDSNSSSDANNNVDDDDGDWEEGSSIASASSNESLNDHNDVLPTSYSEMCIKDDHRIELRNSPNMNNAFEDASDWIQQSDSVNKITSKIMNPLDDDDVIVDDNDGIIVNYCDTNDTNDEQKKENFKLWNVKNSCVNIASCNVLFNKNNNDNNNNDYSAPRTNSKSFLASFPKCKDEEIKTNDTATHQLFQHWTMKKNSNKKNEDLPPYSMNAHTR